MKPLVSVVIPTYNRSEFIIRCIDAVLASEYEKFEVIIVDNHSTDNTCDRISERYGNKVKLIQNKKNMMAAGARNAGIDNSIGEYVLFMDDDNLIDKRAIAHMAKDLTDDKKIGVVTALCIQHDLPQDQVVSSKISLYTSKASSVHGDYRGYKELFETDCCENMCMIRREVINKIGYIDTDYFMMLEESDYCRRIKLCGYKAVLDPKAQTVHYRVKSPDENTELRALGIGNPMRTFHFAKNRTVYMRKFAPLPGKILYFLFFVHAFMVYYCYKAIKNRRRDIARAYLKGYVTGFYVKIKKGIYIKNDCKGTTE